jgi:Mor family transcriptional regulator
MITVIERQQVDLNKFRNINEYIPEIKDNYMIDEFGRVYSKIYNRLVNPTPDKDGYYRYLFAPNEFTPRGVRAKYKLIGIHTLVNRIFNGEPNTEIAEPITDHIDGNRQNNYYKNLRWIDRLTNSTYQTRHINRNEFMTDEDIPKIFKDYENGLTLKQIASKYNSNFRFISQILYGDKRLLATLQAGLTPKRSSPLTEFTINSICFDMLDDKSELTKDKYIELGKKYNVRCEAVRYIVNKLLFSNITKHFDFKNKTTDLFDNSKEIGLNSDHVKINCTEFRF